MADVTGPISTLPGAMHKVPDKARCDVHPDRPAVRRVQGETDSFGAELNDLCAECVEELRKAPPPTGMCDWCKEPAQRLVHKRDYDEGMAGPVYLVCLKCCSEYNQQILEEENNYDD